jgi:hypothetical protein
VATCLRANKVLPLPFGQRTKQSGRPLVRRIGPPIVDRSHVLFEVSVQNLISMSARYMISGNINEIQPLEGIFNTSHGQIRILTVSSVELMKYLEPRVGTCGVGLLGVSRRCDNTVVGFTFHVSLFTVQMMPEGNNPD